MGPQKWTGIMAPIDRNCIKKERKIQYHHLIIYLLTARVVGAPQMILQPVFSIYPCSPLPSGTWQTPGPSIPRCRPATSSSAWQLSVYGKNFNVAIFSDTIKMINVKVFVMIVLIWLYRFTPLSVTWIVFQGHSSVEHFWLKISCSYPIKSKHCSIVDYVK